MNAFIAAGLIMAIVAFVGGMAYWSYQARKKRREALQQLANEMRWTFSPEGEESLLSSLGGFKLFSIGHSKRVANLLRGTAKDSPAMIFDYQYTTGAGKSRHTSYQTVLCLSVGGRPLPRFFLRPEHVFDKIGDVVGYKDIDFESFPEFSKKYMLRGENEQEIRSLFGSRVVAFLEREPGLSMEGEAGHLLVYRQRRQLKMDEIRPFLEKGLRILSLLRP